MSHLVADKENKITKIQILYWIGCYNRLKSLPAIRKYFYRVKIDGINRVCFVSQFPNKEIKRSNFEVLIVSFTPFSSQSNGKQLLGKKKKKRKSMMARLQKTVERGNSVSRLSWNMKCRDFLSA